MLAWRAVAITVFSRKFARFTGKRLPYLRPRAAPGFPVNQRVLRDFMDSRGDRPADNRGWLIYYIKYACIH